MPSSPYGPDIFRQQIEGFELSKSSPRAVVRTALNHSCIFIAVDPVQRGHAG